MIIKDIALKNYRNYTTSKTDFTDGLNVLIGANAQGKTNLLEAIYYCSIGKSLRTNKEKEVINMLADTAKITVNVQKKFSNSKIEIIFSKKEKKTIKINSIPIKRIGDLFGELNCVFFSPDELKLIKESPEDRRRFMNIDISQVSKNYFYLLSRYEKTLANRNKLLKETKDFSVIKNTIPIWNEGLADTGSKIIFSRIKFLEKLNPFAKLAHSYLTDNKEELNLSYSGIIKDSVKEIKEKLLTDLDKNLEKDYKLGFTSVGPHRDDIKILVNDIDIRIYGSQGQQRTTALSMKLAELEILKNETGEMPILLLDDVMSELDENRRKKLINFASKAQTILTCTDFEFNKLKHNTIKIKNGTIV